MFKRAKTYDNQTREYSKVGELLIGDGTTGFLEQGNYQDMGLEGMVTREAVCMRKMRMEP